MFKGRGPLSKPFKTVSTTKKKNKPTMNISTIVTGFSVLLLHYTTRSFSLFCSSSVCGVHYAQTALGFLLF